MKTTPIQPVAVDQSRAAKTTDAGPGFKEQLLESINQTNEKQHQAHAAMESLATGKTHNIHETMIAIQKAEISFKMLVQVRNKIMNAYQEMMRMQV